MKIPFCSFRIFICHASEDREIALELSTHLRSEGHEVFLDEESLPPGATYVGRIRKALRRSQLFLFLVSPDSVEPKRYTLSELDEAVQKWRRPKGRIMPVQVRDTPAENLPPQLKPLHVLEPKGNLSAEVVKVVSARARRRCAGIYGTSLVALLLATALLGGGSLGWGPTPPQPPVVCKQVPPLDMPEIDGFMVIVKEPTPPPGGFKDKRIPRAIWDEIAADPTLAAVSWDNDYSTVVYLGSELPVSHSYKEEGLFEINVFSADMDGDCKVQTRMVELPGPGPTIVFPDEPPWLKHEPPPVPCTPCPRPCEPPVQVDPVDPLPLPQPACACLAIGQRQEKEIRREEKPSIPLVEGLELKLKLGDVDRKKIEYVRLSYQASDPPDADGEEGVVQRDGVEVGGGAFLVFEIPGPTPQQLEVEILAVEAGFFGGKGKAAVRVCRKN